MTNILSEEGKAARKEYFKNYRANRTQEQKDKEKEYIREWRKSNKDKVKSYNDQYWENKARKEV